MYERLVILGSTLTGLALVRDAHAHRLQPVVVDRSDGIAFRSRYAIACPVPDRAPDEVVLDRVIGLGGPGSAIIATGDPWVRFIVRQRASLDAAFGAVLHPDNEALEICLDKKRFSTWCAAHGLDAPKSWLAGAEPRPPGLEVPVLVRPAQTLHGGPQHGLPKAVEVHSEHELEALLARFAEAGCQALVSESLLGPKVVQYSVPFARKGGALSSFVARKVRPAPERCAVGTFVELSPQPQVEALARGAVEELDYFGIGEVEILHLESTGRSALVEINARPWLQYPLAAASGHDFLGLLLDVPGPPRRVRKTGLRWIDLQSDLFGALSSSEGVVRKGELGALEYLRSLLGANVWARLDWRDAAPAFHRPTDQLERCTTQASSAEVRDRGSVR